jgi:hypothetical protein
VHDGWDSSGVSTACRHALGTVHHLREMTVLEEEEQPWATDQARSQGPLPRAPAARADVLQRSQALLDAGLAATPPPPEQERRLGHRGRLKHTPARHLLERLLLPRHEVLGISAFLDDLAIPFDPASA